MEVRRVGRALCAEAGRARPREARCRRDGDDLACIHDNGFTYPYDDGNSAHCLGL